MYSIRCFIKDYLIWCIYIFFITTVKWKYTAKKSGLFVIFVPIRIQRILQIYKY